jgi:excisionase family DNA binding protein
MPNVYSTMSLAKEWGCGRTTVFSIISSGRLPAFRLGKDYRITPANAAAYLEEYGHPKDTDPHRRELLDVIAEWGEPFEHNVYFAATHEHVKIGYARRSNLLQRMWAIQCMNPHQVKLLAVAEGNIAVEQEFHRRFRNLNVRGEWFHRKGELVEFIDSLPCKGIPTVTSEPSTLVEA